MNKLATISKWRNIVELSCMINNDELVFYSDEEVTCDLIKKIVKTGSYFDDPILRISRPVFEVEIQAGLDTYYKGRPENDPEITHFIDAYFMMKSVIAFWKSINPEITPSAFLAYHIGSSFYDCMSGGMPKYELFICRSLLQDSRIDLQTQVYPAGKEFIEKTGRDWYTLQDFLSETASDQSFQFEYNQLHGSLPLLPETT